jgi:hypothetical protein
MMVFDRRNQLTREKLNSVDTSRMGLYAISFDGFTQQQNYTALYDRLMHLGARQALTHVWVVETDLSAVDIRNCVMLVLAPTDRLLVSSLRDSAGWNLLINFHRVERRKTNIPEPVREARRRQAARNKVPAESPRSIETKHSR